MDKKTLTKFTGRNTMAGITDLKTLIENISPFLHKFPYVFISLDKAAFSKLTIDPLCFFREEEGITIIIEESHAIENEFTYDSNWACITLNINSSLSAVGFIAAIAGKLANMNISVNPVSAFYHDHLFVPWDKRYLVLEILSTLNKSK